MTAVVEVALAALTQFGLFALLALSLALVFGRLTQVGVHDRPPRLLDTLHHLSRSLT